MKKLFSSVKKLLLLILILPFYMASAQKKADDTKMNAFVSSLMSRMTPDEKIGQLNLVTG